MSKRQNILVALGVVALAVPSAALAKQGDGQTHGHGHHHGKGEHGQGHGKDKPKMYVFKGTYNADGTVHVLNGNGRVKKQHFVGTDVAFDYTNAKVNVADTNLDGTSDINDVASPDAVVVQAKLGRTDPGPQPFAARKLIDQTNPKS
jgi:hypothetical protein